MNDKRRFLKFGTSLVLLMIGAWLFIMSCGTLEEPQPPNNKDDDDLASEDSTSKNTDAATDSMPKWQPELGDADDFSGEGTTSPDATSDSTRLPYYIDEILGNMAEGRIAFNAPDSVVELEQSFSIQLLLEPSKTAGELETRISASGPTESHQIKISETMKARLTGSGFEITAITSEEQLVSARETTEWKWEVKAVKPGTQRLYLTVSAIVKFQDETKTRAIRTFEREMLVKVSLGKKISIFVGKNWQWLWTALAVPAVGWLWKRKSAKKRVKK